MRKRIYGLGAALLGSVALGILLGGCSFGGSKQAADSDSLAEAEEEYHADNDIAMNLRSLIDAINVGEALDSADYNYRGILTDGTGRPLYTDVQGTPGAWDIRVLTENSAVISNLYLGDLLADDLVQYLLTSLDIPDEPLLTAEDDPKGTPKRRRGRRAASEEGASNKIAIYQIEDADLIIEQQTARTPNGAEGPLLKIIVRKSSF